ncbi:Protein of unknown function (DUF2637) [Actinomyces succiniciruminis]|uniref:DUF2637 domain-containing protein n=2 Tax=Actinomyces succiniciruminis TaxID=1522002 RepID=A0A1L7RP47_9ACTO|nr:Protein of unknown function (DUF2637) [Actinomyces succiniciruminis]
MGGGRMGRMAGRLAVAGTAALGLGGFVLSFTALRDLAVRVGMPDGLAWIWPLLIDGLIIEATLAVVRLSQLRSRAVWYAWTLLAGGAVVSVGSNGVHAVATGHGIAGAAAAAVAPVVLLAMTHLTVLLLEKPTDTAVEVAGTLTAQQEETANQALPSAPTPDAAEPAQLPAGDGDEPVPAAREEEARVGLEEWVRAKEEAGATVTGAMVAELLGCSASTGRRRLAALRKHHNADGPRLRLATQNTEQDRKRA